MENSKNLGRLKSLSEKTGIEMIVIDEAEKITKTEATRFVRNLRISSYLNDPIQSSIRQESPKNRTVELPGVSFFVGHESSEELVATLNKTFAYRQCLAFISDRRTRDDQKQYISIIHTSDKYNSMRLQETQGGSYHFSTDSLIEKLQTLEKKYPFHFVAVGDDWLIIQTDVIPESWIDFTVEVLKVCPEEDEGSISKYAEVLRQDNGKVFMWWD